MDPSRLFQLVLPSAEVQERTKYGGGTSVSLSGVTAENASVAVALMETMGFSRTSGGAELASLGVMEFANDITTSFESLGDDFDDHDSPEDPELAAEDATAESSVDSSRLAPDIDGGGKLLRVLVDSDGHRFAEKIYTGMLQHDTDRKGYASYLYGLDNFLFTYRNPTPPKDEPDDDAELASVTGDLAFATTDLLIQLGQLPDEDRTSLEYLTKLLLSPEGETARKKKGGGKEKGGRSGFLSKLMKAMSTSAGEKAVRAWENGDADELAEAFAALTKNVAATMPEVMDEGDDGEPDDGETPDNADEADADGNTVEAPAKPKVMDEIG